MPRETIYKKYNWDDKLDLIESWAREGLTDVEIADKMGINPDTLYKYKKRYPEFAEALKNGKRAADAKVEKALYENAIGFKYEEEVLGNDGTVKEVERFRKPQTSAQKLWLKNRQSDKWRDKKEITGELDVNPIEAIIQAEEETGEDDPP